MQARRSKRGNTPIESAGRALVQWCVDQAAMRDLTRKRSLDGETVFYRPLPRVVIQKEGAN
jgi:hypothetical protein